MSFAQQNALIGKYCAVCHTDAAKNGGLSLEHFDAAQAAPSLAAMLVSKLTSGVPLETVRAAASDPTAAALVSKKMKSGAMGAAGIPIPDKGTTDALIDALASEAAGASEWNLRSTQDPVTGAPLLTASILREQLSEKNAGEAAVYRLVLACNTATHEGEMQLAWAPAPTRGTLHASPDGKAPLEYKVQGTEKMGNGSAGTTGPAAVDLYKSTTVLPSETLTVSNLFPNQTVEFPFRDLGERARQALAPCFNGGR